MATDIRHNWQLDEVMALFALPFNDLMFQAASVHRENFSANAVQMSTLLSIKTGSCPEDCKYCPQSAHHNTNLAKEPLMQTNEIIAKAKEAKEAGASRFCMGAAWRNLNDRDLPQMIEIIEAVKGLELESCMTLGMLSESQAGALKTAGLDYYNHNIDTSAEYYQHITSTRSYQDRLDTLAHVRNAGINVCSGGIIGMGEQEQDRAQMLITLANLPQHPESTPINMLIKVEGTPLATALELDIFDFIKTIAVTRIMMPKTMVRLSAGRTQMSSEAQSWCFFAGANSIFLGDKLLTTSNPDQDEDMKLFAKLGIVAAY